MRVDPLARAELPQVEAQSFLNSATEIQGVEDLGLAIATFHVAESEEGHQQVLWNGAKSGARRNHTGLAAADGVGGRAAPHGFHVTTQAHLVRHAAALDSVHEVLVHLCRLCQ